MSQKTTESASGLNASGIDGHGEFRHEAMSGICGSRIDGGDWAWSRRQRAQVHVGVGGGQQYEAG